MVEKLELLSPNLIQVMSHAITNENLVKYLYYGNPNQTSPAYDPISQPAVADPSSLMFKNIFPQPFDELAQLADCSQLRIYYADGKLSDNVDDVIVIVDIIVAKSLWLCRKNGTPVIRPYEIMSELAKHFRKKSIGTVGRLHFFEFRQMFVNAKFDGIRLYAKMVALTA